MTILNIKIRNLTVIFLITSVLMSCVSYSKLTPSTQIINQNEDFTIEGKFKIKINSIQENGYFILKKQNNLINLTLGKNYLLPEKELNFQYQDLIFLSELINPEEQGFSYEIFPQRLEIGQLISIILGKGYINRIDAWFIDYPESSQKITGFEGYSIESDTASYINESSYIDSLDYYQPIISDDNLWEGYFSFRGSMRPSTNTEDEWNKDFWLNSNFDVNLTKQWAVAYSMRFDLIDNDILSHSFYIYRQLHCWIFSFKWYPGVRANDYAGSGFQLLIRVKNPDLQDIRIRQTSGNMFGFL